jgi:hypothetical protein
LKSRLRNRQLPVTLCEGPEAAHRVRILRL